MAIITYSQGNMRILHATGNQLHSRYILDQATGPMGTSIAISAITAMQKYPYTHPMKDGTA